MDCCQCRGIEEQFDRREAEQRLKSYRTHGSAHTTSMLIGELLRVGVDGMTLLDIGGGIGAIQHALLQAGASFAISVDASSAYIAIARSEAEQRGLSSQITQYHGDFVEIASTISSADIVTLDRVICCYHDMPALVGASAAKAERLYGLVYPRDTWWIRTGIRVANFVLSLQRTPFRIFAHPTTALDAVVRSHGLRLRWRRATFLWQVVVYERASAR